ncbi:helix-turn-helix domain-containing protein [Clostridium cadaveris]|uniref:helix-turn-helix domain-containing protein n=1 Tax=Clostridium cadaveris TaxID=1529 RepID=UPI000C06B398|nr:helix-turn-helix transcriptional regulator [Clostridium cadaveris]NWK10545.1 helix-turn-helix transcriptional regulator [Clostridium cadaveris]
MIENNNLLVYIGKKIKLYRKLKGMNAAKLAASIHKSRATIAKYEAGKIAMDLGDLADISKVLDVELKYLLDYKREQPVSSSSGLMQLSHLEYLYLYKISDKKIQTSVVHMIPSDDPKIMDAVLYYNMSDGKNMESCSCVYHGVMKNHENILTFILYNYYNNSEIIMINVEVPMRRAEYWVGMLQGVSYETLRPINFKVIITQNPWNKSMDELKHNLMISKEVIKEMKDKNIVTINL